MEFSIAIPNWLLITFLAALGASVGSFLNVVIYRLPRDISLITPPSSCPACGKRIAFYDNIPVLSWFLLLGKCRKCKAKISPRYFIIELLTALLFVGLYLIYFKAGIRKGIGRFETSGYWLYSSHIIMLAILLASSAIDLELWIIPLCLCWFLTAVGIVAAGAAPFFYGISDIRGYNLFPFASAKIAAMAAGAVIGLLISLVLLYFGIIKRSYDDIEQGQDDLPPANYPHRRQMLKEVIFLCPAVICSFIAVKLYINSPAINSWWVDFSQTPAASGICGSLWGYLIGGGIVWATRILGTFAFGKEAMGLGDVHLMAAAGAVLGVWPTVAAFFIAPFFGLLWALASTFFKKTRQIPYGPFLSIGLFVVMIAHDAIIRYIGNILYH